MGMISEFKEFALKGNLVDMAVGIVVGGATGSLVGSLIDNLINPITSLFMGSGGLSGLKAKIGEGTFEKVVNGVVQKDPEGKVLTETGPLYLQYGAFLDAIIKFLILMAVVFVIVKAVNTAKKAAGLVEPPPPQGPTDNELLKDIRNALVKN